MAIKKLPSTGDKPRSTGVPASLVPGGSGDSAGYPWAGRTFANHDTTFADDAGFTPAAWAEVLGRLKAAAAEYADSDRSARFLEAAADAVAAGRVPAELVAGLPAVEFVAGDAERSKLAAAQAAAIEVLAGIRLLIPLVTDAGEVGVTPEGKTVDKTQELAVAFVQGPHGLKTLPVFSSVEAMRAWNAQARPIPVPAPQAAVAAAEEGAELMVIDPGREGEFACGWGIMRALSLGEKWLPAWADARFASAVLALLSRHWGAGAAEEQARGGVVPSWLGLMVETADPLCRQNGAEAVLNLLVDWEGFASSRSADGVAPVPSELAEQFAGALQASVAELSADEALRQVVSMLQLTVCVA